MPIIDQTDAPPATLGTAQVAAALGVTITRVHQLARARKVVPEMAHSRRCCWPADAVERLRPGRPGWPVGRRRAVSDDDDCA